MNADKKKRTQKLENTMRMANIAGLWLMVALVAACASGPDMIPLKTQLSDPDRAVQCLAQFQIPSRWDDAEKMLYVPEDKEHKAVLILGASKLLPSAQSKYAFLSGADLTEADPRTQEKIRTTLEDILSQTIEAFDFIREAEVRIGPMDERRHAIGETERVAKASVVLQLKSGETLDESRVTAIAQMISFGYPNLPPENVAISDTDGRVYRYPEQKR